MAVIAVGLLVGWLLQSDEEAVATVGGPAPDFTVPLIGGGTFTLSDHQGPIVLNQWASWCIPCRTEIPELSAFAEANPEVTVVGVAVEDTENAATEFADEMMPGFPLGIGDSDFERSYPRLGLPVTYIIDEDGRVKDLFNGIVNSEILESLVYG